MKRITSILLAGSSVLFITACGGGGSSDSTEPNTNIYDLRTFIDTKGYTIEGEGTISIPNNTINLTGTYQSIYRGESTAPTGETVHNHDIGIILSADSITITQSSSSITYEGNIVYIDN